MFLTGVQLLTVDEKIPGPARERLLVSYYRYSGQAGHNSHVDTVCELLRQPVIFFKKVDSIFPWESGYVGKRNWFPGIRLKNIKLL